MGIKQPGYGSNNDIIISSTNINNLVEHTNKLSTELDKHTHEGTQEAEQILYAIETLPAKVRPLAFYSYEKNARSGQTFGRGQFDMVFRLPTYVASPYTFYGHAFTATGKTNNVDESWNNIDNNVYILVSMELYLTSGSQTQTLNLFLYKQSGGGYIDIASFNLSAYNGLLGQSVGVAVILEIPSATFPTDDMFRLRINQSSWEADLDVIVRNAGIYIV